MRNKDTILLEEAFKKVLLKEEVSNELHQKSLEHVADKFGGVESVLEILHTASKYFEQLYYHGLAFNQEQKNSWDELANHIRFQATNLDTPRRIKRENEYSKENNPNYGLSHD